MRTAEQIAVMQASLEGKRIESRPHFPSGPPTPPDWAECAEPVWNWYEYDYRVAEPAPEPRMWQLAISRGSGAARVVEPGDSPSRLAWEIVRVLECPPGWKLVPPVAARPLPEGVPPLEGEFADFDYWPHYPEGLKSVARGDRKDLAVVTDGSSIWSSGPWANCAGWHGAIRRNTALHAANFGEVAR